MGKRKSTKGQTTSTKHTHKTKCVVTEILSHNKQLITQIKQIEPHHFLLKLLCQAKERSCICIVGLSIMFCYYGFWSCFVSVVISVFAHFMHIHDKKDTCDICDPLLCLQYKILCRRFNCDRSLKYMFNTNIIDCIQYISCYIFTSESKFL